MKGLAQDGSKHRHGLPVNEVDDGNSEQKPKRKPCATRRKIGRGFVYRLRRCRHKGGCGYLIWRNRCPRSSPRCGWTDPAPLSPCDPRRPEQRKQQFGQAVSLFQMRIPGKNKTFNTKVGMLQHSVSDGRGIAHQRGARVIALSPSRLPPSAAARTPSCFSREQLSCVAGYARKSTTIRKTSMKTTSPCNMRQSIRHESATLSMEA
jgi:hypothetical protein